MKQGSFGSANSTEKVIAEVIAGRAVDIEVRAGNPTESHYNGVSICLYKRSVASAPDIFTLITQSLLLRLGSLDRGNTMALVGKSRLQKRYMVAEIIRGVALYRHILPDQYLRELSFSDDNQHLIFNDSQDSLRVARGYRSLPELPEWAGTVKPLLLIRNAGFQWKMDTDSDLDQQLSAESQSPLKRSETENDDDDQVKDNFWSLLSSPLGKDGWMSQLLRQLLNMSSSQEKSDQSHLGVSSDVTAFRQMSAVSSLSKKIKAGIGRFLSSDKLESHSDIEWLPEWNEQKKQYRSGWVRVAEVSAFSDDSLLKDFSYQPNGHRSFLKAMYRAGLVSAICRRESQGEEIALDRLVDEEINRRCKKPGNRFIFQHHRKVERQLEFVLLVDVSSSGLELTSNGYRQIEAQMNLACCVGKALTELGANTTMFGFHSWGRSHVRLQRIKRRQQSWSSAVLQSVRKLSIAGYSRIGAAIRYVNRFHLSDYGGDNRLLVIFSDGYPYDDDYEKQYAESDTRRALEEAHREGTACVFIGVGSDITEEKIRDTFSCCETVVLDAASPNAAIRVGGALIKALSSVGVS